MPGAGTATATRSAMPISAYPVFEHLAGENTGAADPEQLAHPTLPTQIQPTETNMASKANLKSSGREAALARRRALSNQGKQGLRKTGTERTRGAQAKPAATVPAATAAEPTPIATSTASSRPAPVRRAAAGSPSPSESSRALARQRRRALSETGRKAIRSKDRVRTSEENRLTTPSAPGNKPDAGCGCGCKGERKVEQSAAITLSAPGPANGRNGNGKSTRSKRANAALGAKPTGRALSLARRAALSDRGKGATNAPSSAAGLARQANPKLSGRELAQKVRDQRSANGGAGERKSKPSGRARPQVELRGAADQPWKVGVTETAMGQTVTGTKVGRSRKTTGDEPSTCRPVTGTEYMGAEIFREFCQAEPAPGVAKVRVSPTGHGNRVTGNEVGRSPRVTGDEPGTCKLVTGTEYLSPNQYAAFCETRPEPGPTKIGVTLTLGGKPVSGNLVGQSKKVTGDEHGANVRPTGTQYTAPSDIGSDIVPPKVGQSSTLTGGTVTGTRVGRSGRVTGDEPGSCRVVTGDEYVSLDQYQACKVEAKPEPPKVGRSTTNKGQVVSGTQTGRSSKVTGDEPGTCKAITGTPYAGLEQATAYCEPPQQQSIQARTRQLSATPGPRMTGIQPGIDPQTGGRMTGASKGACEPLTGTPYVGADQFAAACGTSDAGRGALPGQSDFPQLLQGEAAPWQGFSVTSPARAASEAAIARREAVTGTAYESSRHITGPFGMGSGKITGTEQFRFDKNRPLPELMKMPPATSAESGAVPEAAAQAAVSRITGEGQSAGSKITGDDWERGDRVTGTEGASARRRNPTRPGPMSAMAPIEAKRNEEAPEPVSRVTGAAGSTSRGALVTYSGGARG